MKPFCVPVDRAALAFTALAAALMTASLSHGDVGIGTDMPTAKLHVVGESNQDGSDLRVENLDPPQAGEALRVIVTDDAGYFHALAPDDLPLSGAETTTGTTASDDDWRVSIPGSALTIDSTIYTNNRVGIGVTIPAYELDIQGDIRATGSLFASNHVITHATFATSDQRFKRDIESYDNGLDHVRAMQPKQFRYTDNAPGGPSERLYYGLIAQDAASIDANLVQSFPLPTSAHDATPETYLGVDSQRLVFTLISAVKALDAKDREIDELRTRLEELEALVTPRSPNGEYLSVRRFPADAFLNHTNPHLQPKEYF